ncbi:hypothetical protein E2C01_020815 [Portunus trituberculatus]|uniref:Uncharacterized protein n=1 Tax=Portunus trituberculatus TaxID=210409 RepID=A0A5B7E174_PORTR|nr:hypothetical protein [Portunus trituberculatus]
MDAYLFSLFQQNSELQLVVPEDDLSKSSHMLLSSELETLVHIPKILAWPWLNLAHHKLLGSWSPKGTMLGLSSLDSTRLSPEWRVGGKETVYTRSRSFSLTNNRSTLKGARNQSGAVTMSTFLRRAG